MRAAAAGGIYHANRPDAPAPHREVAEKLQPAFQDASPLKVGHSYALKDRTVLQVKPGGIVSAAMPPMPPEDCVQIREVHAGTAAVRVDARIPGHIMTGWVDMRAIDAAKSCKLEP